MENVQSKQNAKQHAGSGSGKDKGLSAKQELMYQQKADAAHKIRVEKQRLKEEKQQRQEDFLRKAAEKREKNSQHAEARRLALKHQTNAQMAKKELEVADRQWTLDQERLHRLEQKEEGRKQRREEEAIKAREREAGLSAEQRRKRHEAQERKQFNLQLAEDFEHGRFVKELERMDQQGEADKRARAREEAKATLDAQQQEAERLAQASRELDAAAYDDVQEYLSKEKASRRQSISNRLQNASQWKQAQDQQDNVNALLARKDRELELAAYGDMQRYVSSEKEKRRQSLSDFLQQESDYRRLQLAEAERQDLLDAQSRALDDAAHRDGKNYERELQEQRRASLANRLQQASALDIEMAHEQERKDEEDEASRDLDQKAGEDARQYVEDEREREKDETMQQAQDELNAAKKLERQVEDQLHKLNELKQKDIEDYKNSISDKYFFTENDGTTIEHEDEDPEVDEKDAANFEDVNLLSDGDGDGDGEDEDEDDETATLPAPPPVAAPIVRPVPLEQMPTTNESVMSHNNNKSKKHKGRNGPPSADACCVIL